MQLRCPSMGKYYSKKSKISFMFKFWTCFLILEATEAYYDKFMDLKFFQKMRKVYNADFYNIV